MRKIILVILFGSLALTLATVRSQDAKFAAAAPAASASRLTSFDQALAEARRLADTDAGKAYEGEFGKAVAPRLGDVVGECTKNRGPTVKFQIIFVFAADGQLEQVLAPKGEAAAACLREKLRDLHLPAPPHANWPVSLNVNISPDKAPRLLVEALNLMESATWEVDATISRGKKMRVHGLLAGNDFDLTLEPEDRNAVRQIAIKDQLWASFDGGKTWKPQSAGEQATFRRVFAFVHNPLRSEAISLALQVAKQETRDGDTWMQLRPKTSGKKKSESERMEYWIAISQDPKRNGVRRYEGQVTEPGHEKEPLHCVATYQPANNKAIQPPASAAALPEEQSAPSVSPDAKFASEKAPNSKDNRPSERTTVSLLDGKLKIDLSAGFSRDPDDPNDQKTLAKFSGPDGAWGKVLRGTHGLTPDKLEGYLKMRVAEYSNGFKWLPKDSHLQWLKKEIVTIDGRKWADWSFVPMLKGKKDYSHNPAYARNLTTSYKGQLLEINFTSNLNTSPDLKKQIDHIMDSVHLEE
jgi:hypothetical protein